MKFWQILNSWLSEGRLHAKFKSLPNLPAIKMVALLYDVVNSRLPIPN